MKTNFFQNIAALNTPGTFKLAITVTGQGELSVSELFSADCGDKAVNRIIPLTLTGTAEELDEGFFEKITEPTQKAAGLMSNMEAHLKSVEAARLASKLEQDKKQKEGKANASTIVPKKDAEQELPDFKAEKKKAYDAALKSIAELNANCKYEVALAILPAPEEHPDRAADIEKLRAELTRKYEQYKQIQLF
jgi:PRTRC genetic system protein E